MASVDWKIELFFFIAFGERGVVVWVWRAERDARRGVCVGLVR